jgi:hypothetical protein
MIRKPDREERGRINPDGPLANAKSSSAFDESNKEIARYLSEVSFRAGCIDALERPKKWIPFGQGTAAGGETKDALLCLLSCRTARK